MLSTTTNIKDITKASPFFTHPNKPYVVHGNAQQLHKNFVRPQRPFLGTFSPRKLRGDVGEARRASLAARRRVVVRASSGKLFSYTTTSRVKITVSVKPPNCIPISSLMDEGYDKVLDFFCGDELLLELVSAEVDPETGREYVPLKTAVQRAKKEGGLVKYEGVIDIPSYFGEVGAVTVENEHHTEMHLIDFLLTGFPDASSLLFPCHSWVSSSKDTREKRIFFTNKSYLPSKTPKGLNERRKDELKKLRGEGESESERKAYERVYDYDTYNDLGDPDNNPDLARPVLGGHQQPYPRRCRTGRPRCKTDPESEARSESVYVPRDEQFSEVKQQNNTLKTLLSGLHTLLPYVEANFISKDPNFPTFTAIDSLYNQEAAVQLPEIPDEHGDLLSSIFPWLVKSYRGLKGFFLRFNTPSLFQRDRFSWFRDEEFGRQALAGLNPCSIKLITEWPLKSKLDPEIYGPPESAITTELIQEQLKGYLTVEEAIEQKKLFMLDYHDVFLPYVNEVRKLEDTTLYASRTLFVLMPSGTLRPLAIELTRPPHGVKPQWKQVFTPSWDATENWLWRFAKAHVLAHDSGYHQLISHWLRAHCCTEPYIIAANRQMSALHPIYRLLRPYFRYTMEINAQARKALINAGGIIEGTFAPGKYSILLSSVIFDQEWRFDHQALPADLIARGIATEDPTAEHGLKLAIEDYPYANDGLIVWDAIKEWVADYVKFYYGDDGPSTSTVEADEELQAWWWEVRHVGHGDKKDEPWWPDLRTRDDLIQTLTTIIWVASGHHAAVNFGQYGYAGYFPNRPTITRAVMPTEDPTEQQWKLFVENPEKALLQCFPTQVQATKVMMILNVLSNHSPDEEYLGEKPEPAWEHEDYIKRAFDRFKVKVEMLEATINGSNANAHLKNRGGAGIVPFELLLPTSQPGVTGRGIPNSVSI